MATLVFPPVHHVGAELEVAAERRLRALAAQTPHQFSHNLRKVELGHMSQSHMYRRPRATVCASVTLPKGTAAVKRSVMEKRIAAAFIASALVGFWMSACGAGGQTYDDGADGLGGKRPKPTVADDSSDDTEAVGTSSPSGSTEQSEAAESNTSELGDNTNAASDEVCRELVQQADDAVSELRASVDTACVVDDDCVSQVLPLVACNTRDGCSVQTAISAAGLPAVLADLETLNSELCGEFDDLGCMHQPSPFSPCSPPITVPAWCPAGTCELDFRRSCEAEYPDAWSAVEEVYDDANRDCANDTDCTMFTSSGVSCTPGFSARCDAETAVNADAIADFETALELVEAESCFDYAAGDCQISVNPIACPVGRVARCIEEECVAVIED
jgi:hypothetical protein